MFTVRRGIAALSVCALALVAGGIVPAVAAPPTGWAGETIIGAGDTWEPYVAADPGAPYVYTIYNDFSGPKACNTCPSPFMVSRTSSDDGATFGPEVRLCSCAHVSWEYDPTIAVASTGAVYAVFMNEYTIVFIKSTDHGATWSAPLKVSGKLSSDKPWLGISPNGTDVYIAWTKGTGGDLYEAHSHDGGSSFSTAQMIGTQPNNHYYYPNGFGVLPSGAAVLSASLYPGSSRQTSGLITITTFRTTNGGTSWTRSDVDTVSSSVDFDTSSTTTVSNDVAGTLVLEYSGATTTGGNGHIYVRRSTDGGVTWSARNELTPTTGGGNASFPAIDGGASGVFRLTWMEERAGAWNVYYRASTDGGATWSAEADISESTSGAAYKSAAGFASPYGDYDGVAITNTGKTIAVSGQGASFGVGPGNIWLNRQT
jgi:hypothetical protein